MIERKIKKYKRKKNLENGWSLEYGAPNILQQRATPVFAGWFEGRTCKNDSKMVYL